MEDEFLLSAAPRPPKHREQEGAAAHPQRLRCEGSCHRTADQAASGKAPGLHPEIAAIASLKAHPQGPSSEKAHAENMQRSIKKATNWY